MRWHKHAGVDPGVAGATDESGVRAFEPSDGAQQRTLTAATWSEDRRHAVEGDFRGQAEIELIQGERQVKTQVISRHDAARRDCR